MDAARAQMMDRLRKAQLPQEKQEALARNAIRDARGALALLDLRLEKGEAFFDPKTQQARGVDRRQAKDDALNPWTTLENQTALLKKRGVQVRALAERLIAALEVALNQADDGVVDIREKLEAATRDLERIVEA